MKVFKRLAAIGMCGIVLGVTASMVTAGPATGRYLARCDQKITNMEKQAARDFKKGKLSAEDYAKVQAEIAYHRELWGC
jgi:hypothetical protein